MIIAERHIDLNARTIKPVDVGGVAGGTKFSVHGLFFKYPLDSKEFGSYIYGGYQSNNIFAGKACKHDLIGLAQFAMADEDHLFHTPLFTIIDFQGFRLTVMTTLPIEKGTLLYGSDDKGKTMNCDQDIHKKLLPIARTLNIRVHKVTQHEVDSVFCGDLEVHKFQDLEDKKSHFFVLDTARIFPPAAPTIVTGAHGVNYVLFRMLRPELVKENPSPLSSDAFTGWQTDPNSEQYNQDVVDATRKLLQIINDYGAKLATDNYMIKSIIDVSIIRIRNTIDGWPVMDPIVRELHNRGINIRYLAYIVTVLIKNNSSKDIIYYLLAMIIARSMKNLWKDKIMKEKNEHHHINYEICLKVTMSVINAAISFRNESSDEFLEDWDQLFEMIKMSYVTGLLEDDDKEMFMNELRTALGIHPTKSKCKINIGWAIVNFAELCGVSFMSLTKEAVLGEDYFTFSRADIDTFVPIIKSPPSLIYYTALNNYKQGKKTQLSKTKLSFMGAAVVRFANIITFKLPKVKYVW